MRRFRLPPSSAGPLLAGLLLTLGGISQAMAQADPSNRPLWLRHPAVSPDGQHIAFVYGGQLWRVPAGHGGSGAAGHSRSGARCQPRPGWPFHPLHEPERPGERVAQARGLGSHTGHLGL